MINIAVLISDKGRGTNLQAIINGIKKGKISGEIVVVVSDTSKAIGLERARKNNIKVEICPHKNQLIKILKKYQPDFIALAGWKQIISDEVIEAYTNKILNLHPGLIPDKNSGTVKNPNGTDGLWNRGLLAEKAVNNFLVNHATYAGSSIHFLTKEFDFGEVLARTFVKIKKNDTIDSLYSRIKKKENQNYVEVLQKLSANSKFTVMVIDGGGRGSAIIDKYAQSPNVEKILAVPGNDLIPILVKKPVKFFPYLKTTDIKEISEICQREKVDLIDVAQDDAVAVGLVDSLIKSGFKVFGPTKAAGRIEWDKAWSRNFMQKFKIPHPDYKICKSYKEGIDYIKKQKDAKWFIKASGLAAGKGAIYSANKKDAINAVNSMKNFGKAGETFLIEKCLIGEEFSAFAILNGKKFEIVGFAQDHKQVFDGDLGPNTGGMGCSMPPVAITKRIESQVKSIFKKTAEGLVTLKRPYLGILYLGGMIDEKGKVWTVEFNARWGDPEAQVILPSIKNDLYELVSNTIKNKIPKIKRDSLYRVAVTAASKGYPNDYSEVVGKQIFGLSTLLGHPERSEGSLKVFGAGVKINNGKFIVGSGRLFYVLGEGKNVAIARKLAYNALSLINIEGDFLHFRTDIGWRDLARYNRRR
ncbi:phosphoribosylamine--glycine ligase [Candidatus Curtissbacteria bacterium RIFCSPLOWO2_01_FULL_38_11b]|uniref:phosphoribosylamine--glycine ligase n=1 Tax=Candidatus Curtissbacteria bacterium RIFCSPLOWO2_01_FULL_38_11b TaxID=1797725 RepID=A0A1F5H036_9BACT|nr:MAG: phosphoribosylamine--glycine ligase [Candidatus Curtissbacteria bacterium RIFCSPLOWO2_01_FULL_38_11b]